MRRCHLLLNRGAGGNQRGLEGDEVCRMVEKVFGEAGHGVVARIFAPGKLEEALEAAVRERPDAVIVAGGDGTVSAAAKHLGGTGIALGILPMGTFNLAARDLGVPLDLEEAARFLADAEALPIDVMDVAGHACLCTTIFGCYPEFARTFESRDHGGWWWRKAIKVARELPRAFAESRPLDLSWTGDGGEGRARTKFSAFVPGRYRAAAGIVPVRSEFRSGMMTAYVGRQRRAGAAMRGVFDYVCGRQEENPELTIFKAGRIELRAGRRRRVTAMIDGEILQLTFPLKLEILPEHLMVLSTAETLEDPS